MSRRDASLADGSTESSFEQIASTAVAGPLAADSVELLLSGATVVT